MTEQLRALLEDIIKLPTNADFVMAKAQAALAELAAPGGAGGVMERMARAMEPMTFKVLDQVESGEYRAAPGYGEIVAKVNQCRKYAVAALAALPALSQQTQNSNHLDIKDRENENRAAQDVLAERQRQIEREGWTTDHDDEHDRGELAQAAACYASPKPIYLFNRDYEDGMTGHMLFEGAWPWDSAWWKPQHRRRDLVKAGALILAEIERLDRAALPTAPKQEE